MLLCKKLDKSIELEVFSFKREKANPATLFRCCLDTSISLESKVCEECVGLLGILRNVCIYSRRTLYTQRRVVHIFVRFKKKEKVCVHTNGEKSGCANIKAAMFFLEEKALGCNFPPI